jgi:hypothetical protein
MVKLSPRMRAWSRRLPRWEQTVPRGPSSAKPIITAVAQKSQLNDVSDIIDTMRTPKVRSHTCRKHAFAPTVQACTAVNKMQWAHHQQNYHRSTYAACSGKKITAVSTSPHKQVASVHNPVHETRYLARCARPRDVQDIVPNHSTESCASRYTDAQPDITMCCNNSMCCAQLNHVQQYQQQQHAQQTTACPCTTLLPRRQHDPVNPHTLTSGGCSASITVSSPSPSK